MGQITFGNYTVTTGNFFVITIHYIKIVLTSTVYSNRNISLSVFSALLLIITCGFKGYTHKQLKQLNIFSIAEALHVTCIGPA